MVPLIYSNIANERYCHIKIGTNWGIFCFTFANESYCHIKIGTRWCLFILTVLMRDIVGTNWGLFCSICANERYYHIKIGTNWGLFIYSNCDNERCIVISRSGPDGASLFSLTVLMGDIIISRSAPILAFFCSICAKERYCPIKIGTIWGLFGFICANESYCHIKIGTRWCLFIYSNCANERYMYCHIKIGTNWGLFISIC